LTARDSKDGNEEGLKDGNKDSSLGDGQSGSGAVVRAMGREAMKQAVRVEMGKL
jgi:hypothetical protein